jgi:hypothetical protein
MKCFTCSKFLLLRSYCLMIIDSLYLCIANIELNRITLIKRTIKKELAFHLNLLEFSFELAFLLHTNYSKQQHIY